MKFLKLFQKKEGIEQLYMNHAHEFIQLRQRYERDQNYWILKTVALTGLYIIYLLIK